MGSKLKVFVTGAIYLAILIFLPHSHGRALTEKCRTLPLKTLDGKSITLESLYGRASLVVFFESTCIACQRELRTLGKLKGKNILAVAMDRNKGLLEEYLRREKPPFPVVLYTEGLRECFGEINQVPTLFFLSPELFITGEETGALQEEEIRKSSDKIPSCHCNF